MRNLPKGVWANFTSTCHVCREEITVRDGRPERHECRERIDLDMGAFQDALGDYYDSGAIGDPPKR